MTKVELAVLVLMIVMLVTIVINDIHFGYSNDGDDNSGDRGQRQGVVGPMV